MPREAIIPHDSMAAHVVDSLSDIGSVECKRFFGGWSLRLHGKQFAMALNDRLYLAVDKILRADLIARGSSPFRYEKSGRTVTVEKYYEAPPELLDDPEMLQDFVRRILASG